MMSKQRVSERDFLLLTLCLYVLGEMSDDVFWEWGNLQTWSSDEDISFNSQNFLHYAPDPQAALL